MKMNFPAIDVHAHIGTAAGLPFHSCEKRFADISVEDFIEQNRLAGIEKSFVSPLEALFPAGNLSLNDANKYVEELSIRYESIYQWVVIDPSSDRIMSDAEKILGGLKCVGIKLHPAAHRYNIKDCADEVFALAESYNKTVLVHTAEEGCMPEDMVETADKYSTMKLICAHLGFGADKDPTHQINAIKESNNKNIYADVSSMKSLQYNLIEWAVTEVGADRLLFGTDAPLHHAAMIKARVEYSCLPDEDKIKILSKNAEHIFNL